MNLTLSLGYPGSPTFAGYKLYWATTSRGYSNLYGNSSASSPQIVTLNGPDSLGNYTIDLPLLKGTRYYFAATAYTDENLESGFSPEYVLDIPANRPPVASLPPTISAFSGEIVAIDGTDSVDPDHDALTYLFEQTAGISVELFTPTGSRASFIAPEVGPYGEILHFRLTVRDSQNAADSTIIAVEIFPDSIESSEIATIHFGGNTVFSLTNPMPDSSIDSSEDSNTTCHFLTTASTGGDPATNSTLSTIIFMPDASAVPPFSLVLSAQLSLYQFETSGADLMTISAHQIDGVTPLLGEANGVMASAYTPWSAPTWNLSQDEAPLGLGNITPAADTLSVDTSTGWKSWDIRSIVQNWTFDPQSNSGLLLVGSTSSLAASRSFISSDDVQSALRPVMEITTVSLADTDADQDFDGLDIARLAAQISVY